MPELAQRYEHNEVEPRIRKFWADKGVFSFNPKTTKKIFSVDTPPPTISGKMHLGHACSYTQQDFMVRFKRMQGFEIFYPFGTDDNGLATDRMIEKMKGVKSAEMGREEYVKLVLKALEEIRPAFVEDWKKLGVSCDFSYYYTTIDEHSRRISQKSFIDLYDMGREYRKESPTLWCPECRMAIAQVEMKDKEISSVFNDIIFKIDGKDVAIATTRPELLPACVAVFVHPDDKRYEKLVGKKAKVPLLGFDVPVLKDERVEQEKGTGIVMCCTFGDQTDIEWYLAHKLPLKMVLTREGRLNENAGKYAGLSIRQARKQIIEDLKAAGLLTKEEPIKHNVNTHERCGTEIEILNAKCWFIKYLDLKETFLELGKKMKWYPDFMQVRYQNWIKGLQWDWCISRQRHYGVPFPLWYCKKCGEVMLADEKDLPVDPTSSKPKKKCKCGSADFEPETDVMDTWATSSLSPQLCLQLVKDEKVRKKMYPMSLRPQAHDIITFWLFNTVVKSWLHFKTIPWTDIAISGYVLDPHGQKMSKSKGNVIDP
ncbi:MAG: valine--tRNA ligase, partial [Candidatus Aenigmatarchaeota archaeon]